jgi:hypothetical protein
MEAPAPTIFQRCGSCGHEWPTFETFTLDARVRPIGVQIVPDRPDLNVLVFEHACGSSVSVRASRLRHLLGREEPTVRPSLFGTEVCNGHCRLIENMKSCDQPCANASDRRLLLLIAAAQKEGRLPEPPRR